MVHTCQLRKRSTLIRHLPPFIPPSGGGVGRLAVGKPSGSDDREWAGAHSSDGAPSIIGWPLLVVRCIRPRMGCMAYAPFRGLSHWADGEPTGFRMVADTAGQAIKSRSSI
jgi:hypothetical protein